MKGEAVKYGDPVQLYMVEPSGEYPITPLINNRIRGITWSPSGEEVIVLADEQVIIITPKVASPESKLTGSNENMNYDENIDWNVNYPGNRRPAPSGGRSSKNTCPRNFPLLCSRPVE